ncbi:MAG: hypothetical protein KAU38_03430 [Desulfobacterales bacterium]|nr:hypothetical protein [Desulfobacterales bacterium]
MATKDYDWFVNSELTEYRGEYVIILHEKVVYHGKDLTKILKEFRRHHPNQVPKIAKIPEEETLILVCEI